jgi:hypothetical protein
MMIWLHRSGFSISSPVQGTTAHCDLVRPDRNANVCAPGRLTVNIEVRLDTAVGPPPVPVQNCDILANTAIRWRTPKSIDESTERPVPQGSCGFSHSRGERRLSGDDVEGQPFVGTDLSALKFVARPHPPRAGTLERD